MAQPLSDTALDQLFRTARSYNGWLDREVTEEQIHAIYALMEMGPTSANQQSGRLVWCKSDAAKQRLADFGFNVPIPCVTGQDARGTKNVARRIVEIVVNVMSQ